MIKQFLLTVAGTIGLFSIIRGPMVMCGVDKPEDTIEFLEKIKTNEIARGIDIAKEYITVYNRMKNLA
ncbi:hypothetical protein HS5_04400 [Acidianus sp. HS-5]|nr:hypothetical protein HS5_04400 [Acidianus sp. HS-5]